MNDPNERLHIAAPCYKIFYIQTTIHQCKEIYMNTVTLSTFKTNMESTIQGIVDFGNTLTV